MCTASSIASVVTPTPLYQRRKDVTSSAKRWKMRAWPGEGAGKVQDAPGQAARSSHLRDAVFIFDFHFLWLLVHGCGMPSVGHVGRGHDVSRHLAPWRDLACHHRTLVRSCNRPRLRTPREESGSSGRAKCASSRLTRGSDSARSSRTSSSNHLCANYFFFFFLVSMLFLFPFVGNRRRCEELA